MRIYILVMFLLSTVNGLRGQTAYDYYLEGLKKNKNENYIGAIAEFNKGIELEPNNSLLYTDRGASKQLLKDYRGAIEDYNKAIKIDPKKADAFYLRGMAKVVMRDIDGGCLDLSKAGELGYIEAYDTIRQLCNH